METITIINPEISKFKGLKLTLDAFKNYQNEIQIGSPINTFVFNLNINLYGSLGTDNAKDSFIYLLTPIDLRDKITPNSFAFLRSELRENVIKFNLGRVIELLKIPASQWEKLRVSSEEFYTADDQLQAIGTMGKIKIMIALGKVDVEQRAAFEQFVKSFNITNIKSIEIECLINDLAKIPLDQREVFIETVNGLITENMDNNDKSDIISSAAAVFMMSNKLEISTKEIFSSQDDISFFEYLYEKGSKEKWEAVDAVVQEFTDSMGDVEKIAKIRNALKDF